MKTPRIYIGALAVFCVAALVIGSAGAAAMMQKGAGNTFKNTGGKGPTNGMANMTQLKEFRTAHQDGFPAFANCSGKSPKNGVANETRMLEMLDNLTAKGYDVSAIRTAVESGDLETTMTLLKEFMTANPDAGPARGDGIVKGPKHGVANETRMLEMLDNLTAKGYDVSSISAAVTSGDYTTAMTLLEEFRTAHPDSFPAFGEGTGKGPMHGEANGERMSQLLSNLTAKGYDVSSISAAVTSGDYTTAMTLLEEFMTANPDACPARGDGTGSGHKGGQWRAQNT